MQSLFRKCMRHTLIGNIRQRNRLNKFRRQWIRQHNDGDTVPMNIFPEHVVSVGRGSYGELNVITFSDKSRLTIGKYVSIAQNVSFLLDVEHHLNHLSTFPFKVKIVESEKYEAFSKGDIVIDDDVWIGFGATILSGVHIGQGAVVATGAVVVGDIPPYAIYGGVPARLIKYRFKEINRDFFQELDFNNLTNESIDEHLKDLYIDLDCFSLEEIHEKYNWMSVKH